MSPETKRMEDKLKQIIESISNKQIKHILQLQKKSKARKENQEFVMEGIRVYKEIPKEKILRTYVSQAFFSEHSDLIEERTEGNYEIVADKIFAEIADTKTPQGVLMVVQMPNYDLRLLIEKENVIFLVLDDIQDPGNLGTMLRTAEAAGVNGILMSKDTVDIYNPKVVRSTMGAIYRVPFFYMDRIEDTLKELRNQWNFEHYAASLEGAATFTEISYGKKVCIVIGNEGNGIGESVLQICQNKIRIPMEGETESLNAAVSAALIMYEIYRQKKY